MDGRIGRYYARDRERAWPHRQSHHRGDLCKILADLPAKGGQRSRVGGEQSVADFQAIAYQFLSIKEPPMGVVRRPASQVGTKITFEFSVIGKPFDISFASIKGRNPDIGVIQYVDSSDHYADMRWPTCYRLRSRSRRIGTWRRLMLLASSCWTSATLYQQSWFRTPCSTRQAISAGMPDIGVHTQHRQTWI